MSNQYIHYTKRKIVQRFPPDINDPWYAELQKYSDGFDVPLFHVTRSSSWPATEIKAGDVIWLVGQLDSPWGKLPPSIDAKIVVKSAIKFSAPSRTKFEAGNGSSWYPLRDASSMLSELIVCSKSGQHSSPFHSRLNNLGQAFQSIKKISNPGDINCWASQLESDNYDFISYRIKYGTKCAFEAVTKLLKDGKSVFWDRWSLPRRLAERREYVSDAALNSILEQKISQSSVTWGIISKGYGDPKSYSAREIEHAKKLGKYREYTDCDES